MEVAADRTPPDPSRRGDAVATLTVRGDWTALLHGPGRDHLEAVLPDLLRRRRWFGAKARALRRVTLSGVFPLGAGDRPATYVLVARVEYLDGEPDDYVVPVTFVPGEEVDRVRALAPHDVLARVEVAGTHAGSGVLADAVADEDGARALLDTVVRQQRRSGGVEGQGVDGLPVGGELVGRWLEGFDPVHDTVQLDVQPLRGEQSNSSVRFGQRMLMKVLRRLESGVDAEVEVGVHLREVEHVPALLGTLDIVGSDGAASRTLAIVQRYVPGEGDAWTLALAELARFADRVNADPGRAGSPVLGRTGSPALRRGGDPLTLALAGVPGDVHETLGPFGEVARLLGRRTAQVHARLAADGGEAAFTPEPTTRAYLRGLHRSMRYSVRAGLHEARDQTRDAADTSLRDRVRALADRQPDILARIDLIADLRVDATRIRTHGDYHLGQVLWTGDDVAIIDFGGEPARPAAERRRKHSALRDLAGMLRSLHYATAATLRDQLERGLVTPSQPDHDALEAWLAWWLDWAGAAFLEGYLDVAGGQGFVPAEVAHSRMLLDAFLLEKAFYELGYELNHRPTWVGIPLHGITQVLDRHDR